MSFASFWIPLSVTKNLFNIIFSFLLSFLVMIRHHNTFPDNLSKKIYKKYHQHASLHFHFKMQYNSMIFLQQTKKCAKFQFFIHDEKKCKKMLISYHAHKWVILKTDQEWDTQKPERNVNCYFKSGYQKILGLEAIRIWKWNRNNIEKFHDYVLRSLLIISSKSLVELWIFVVTVSFIAYLHSNTLNSHFPRALAKKVHKNLYVVSKDVRTIECKYWNLFPPSSIAYLTLLPWIEIWMDVSENES